MNHGVYKVLSQPDRLIGGGQGFRETALGLPYLVPSPQDQEHRDAQGQDRDQYQDQLLTSFLLGGASGQERVLVIYHLIQGFQNGDPARFDLIHRLIVGARSSRSNYFGHAVQHGGFGVIDLPQALLLNRIVVNQGCYLLEGSG